MLTSELIPLFYVIGSDIYTRLAHNNNNRNRTYIMHPIIYNAAFWTSSTPYAYYHVCVCVCVVRENRLENRITTLSQLWIEPPWVHRHFSFSGRHR